jgi:hypothetical protein
MYCNRENRRQAKSPISRHSEHSEEFQQGGEKNVAGILPPFSRQNDGPANDAPTSSL